jgi:hypothetical protein
MSDDPTFYLAGQDAPLVRPYVMTGGRVEPTGTQHLDLAAQVASIPVEDLDHEHHLGPEHREIVGLCQSVMSVAEITAHLRLPVAAVRVLLSDLLDNGYVSVQAPEADMHDLSLYRAVIDGIRSL